MNRWLLALVAVISTTLWGCMNHDTEDGPVKRYLTDIVTYEGDNGQGGTRFTFQKADDSPLITLDWQGRLQADGLNRGTRLLIQYYPLSGQPYQSGDVELRGAARITCDTIMQVNMSKHPDWQRDRVYVYSLWRTGRWLNMHCRLPYSPEPRTFTLGVEDSTLYQEFPQVYIIHQLDSVAPRHDREYYVSWDIGPVWNNSTIHGLDVHVANSNMPQTIFPFRKQGRQQN